MRCSLLLATMVVVADGFVGPSIVGMGTDSTAARQVDDEWAPEYTKNIRSRGYQLPELAADLVRRHTSELERLFYNVLDAGAGDGLALRQAGFEGEMVGQDLSPKMLGNAHDRGCYISIQVSDLNLRLPIDDESLNVVNCIGTLTYVDPNSDCLAEFVRITKPGGLICFAPDRQVGCMGSS